VVHLQLDMVQTSPLTTELASEPDSWSRCSNEFPPDPREGLQWRVIAFGFQSNRSLNRGGTTECEKPSSPSPWGEGFFIYEEAEKSRQLRSWLETILNVPQRVRLRLLLPCGLAGRAFW